MRPGRYFWKLRLKDGSKAVIREIRPADEPLMVRFHQSLSEASVYYRYFCMLKLEERISHSRLAGICFNQPHQKVALVIDRAVPRSAEHEILGVARLSMIQGTNEAEFAIIVSDQWQKQGLGGMLADCAIEVGRAEKLDRLRIVVLGGNREMLRLAERHGFKLTASGEGEISGELSLR